MLKINSVPVVPENLPTVPQDVRIPDRTEYFLSPNKYYSLDEAVEAAKQQHPECTPSHLLNFGYSEKLDFITPVPVGVELHPAYGLSEAPFPPEPMHVPKLLALDATDCFLIDCRGKFEQGSFHKAHNLGYGQPKKFSPNFVNSHGQNVEGSWKTHYQGKPHKIHLTGDRLFVLQSDLARLIKTEAKPWETREEESKRLIEEDRKNTPNAVCRKTNQTSAPTPTIKRDANAEVLTVPVRKVEDELSETELAIKGKLEGTKLQATWLIEDREDHKPEDFKPWYTPARYFARMLVKENEELDKDRERLAKKVANKLASHGFYAWDDKDKKKIFAPGTVKKAFKHINLRTFIEVVVATPDDTD